MTMTDSLFIAMIIAVAFCIGHHIGGKLKLDIPESSEQDLKRWQVREWNDMFYYVLKKTGSAEAAAHEADLGLHEYQKRFPEAFKL